jgi:EAL domain-containing protein (putative c-di-GMP-specific phosphodiesterase class I)
MYRAKSGGKARYEIFDTGMAERAMERLNFETDLRHALERGEIVVEYEPVAAEMFGADAGNGLLARMRWHHPRHGVLEDSEFLRVAEDTGTIVRLGAWLLMRACRDAQAWQRTSPGTAVQVALSCRELQQPELPAKILTALTASGLAPHLLRLELAEEVLGPDRDALQPMAARISQLGVKLTPSRELARAIAALSHALGMTVVGDGEIAALSLGRAA